MAEIAAAYVSLLPSASKLSKGVKDELGKAGDEGGKSAGRRAASSLGTWLKRGVLAVGAAAGGLLATALVKGWGRLTNIENATAKLSGLGNSAKDVSGIMDNALASVKGTAFGLDEAATTAASVVAAGIKPGKDLQNVLKTVADTATIAGKSMADAGAIFGSVAARGKLQGDDLMQLQSAGVPVLAMLAKHYGITAAAASKMVTQGKVDFKNFNAALSENLGGAALKSGETTQGALKNVGAALGRFGAQLAGPAFGGAQKFFVSITGWIDDATSLVGPFTSRVGDLFDTIVSKSGPVVASVKARLKPIGSTVVASVQGAIPTVRKAGTQFWDALMTGQAGNSFPSRIGATLRHGADTAKAMVVPAFQGTIDRLGSIWGKLADTGKRAFAPLMEILGVVVTAFGDVWKSIGSSGLSVWGLLLSAVDGVASLLQTYLVPALQAVAKWMQEHRAVIGAVVSALLAYRGVQLAITIGTKAWALATGLVTAAQNLLNGAMKANPIGLVIGLVAALVAAFIYLWNNSTGFRNFWIGMWDGMKAVVTGFLGFFTQTVPSAFGAVIGWLEANWQTIAQVLISIFLPGGIIIAAVWRFKDQILGVMSAIWSGIVAVWNSVVSFLVAVWAAIEPAVNVAWNLIKLAIIGPVYLIWKIIQAVFNLVAPYFAAVWSVIKSAAGAAWNVFKTVVITPVQALWSLIQTVVGKFAGFLAGVWSAVKSAAKAAWNLFKSYVSGPVNAANSAIRAVFGAIGGFLSGVWSTVKSGAQSAWNKVYDYIVNPIGKAIDWVKTQLGKVAGFFSTMWTDVAGSVKGAFSDVANFASGVFGGITGAVKGALNGVIGALNSAIGFINRKLIDNANKVPFVSIPHIPTIPRLATGGVVADPTVALIGDAGRNNPEIVAPQRMIRQIIRDEMRSRSRDNGPQVTQNIYPSERMSEDSLADTVARKWQFAMAF